MPALRSKNERRARGPRSRVQTARRPARGGQPTQEHRERAQTRESASAHRGLRSDATRTSKPRANERPKAQCHAAKGWWRSTTDPEPDMDGGRATVRNMRSKCRCSYVLQFTFRRAVSCVLHRPPSQVIHCTVLSLRQFTFAPRERTSNNNGCRQLLPGGESESNANSSAGEEL